MQAARLGRHSGRSLDASSAALTPPHIQWLPLWYGADTLQPAVSVTDSLPFPPFSSRWQLSDPSGGMDIGVLRTGQCLALPRARPPFRTGVLLLRTALASLPPPPRTCLAGRRGPFNAAVRPIGAFQADFATFASLWRREYMAPRAVGGRTTAALLQVNPAESPHSRLHVLPMRSTATPAARGTHHWGTCFGCYGTRARMKPEHVCTAACCTHVLWATHAYGTCPAGRLESGPQVLLIDRTHPRGMGRRTAGSTSNRGRDLTPLALVPSTVPHMCHHRLTRRVRVTCR